MGRSKKEKKSLKKRISNAFDIPKDVTRNLPVRSLRGRDEAVVENYLGIIEYDPEKIRISTSAGTLCLTGEKMLIKSLDSDSLIITGKIRSAGFL